MGCRLSREHTLVPQLQSMTSLDRFKPALESPWLPLALLLIALSTVFMFGGDRGSFYRPEGVHNLMSSHHMSIAVNLSPEHGFQRFQQRFIDEDGAVGYIPYNRFPIGGYLLMKLATLPVSGNLSAQIYAARILTLLFFTAIVILAYLSLCRLTSNRWIALTAALLAFSSYYLLYYNDMTANEGMIDLFGVMLTFHGMVIFVQEGRFRQLLVKTCIALLLGWHVLALLLPFVIFGLARDLLRARSAAASSTPPPVMSSRVMASTLLRSRYLMLGIVALAFGLSVLTFNFTMEYIALDGETPLTELSSFKSMLRRTEVGPVIQSDLGATIAWSPFLEGQFRKILRVFVPYALPESLKGILHRRDVVLGVVLSLASLVGSMFVRPRILFATLASFGFFWALPVRTSTHVHEFEAIYYIGLPLVFFTIVLLLAKRLTNRDGIIATASVIALLLFTVSSFQMGRVGHDAETAQAARAAEQELLVIRELTAGEFIVSQVSNAHFFAWGNAAHAMDYYLNSVPINYAHIPAAEGGFVVMRQRVDIDALLTPQNQHFFLYDRAGMEAWYAAAYRQVAASQPLAREEFNLYLDHNQLYYLKEPCVLADTQARFFLHVTPVDSDNIPDDRRQHGFNNLDFEFLDHGMLFGDKCLVRFVLPQYAISKINTGRIGDTWNVAHLFHPPKLIAEYPSIVSREPIARSEFDLYLDRGKLYYVKEPCVLADTQARFFLHVIPEDLDDLPDHRRQHGFDNLDFDFGMRGVQFDGKCVASVDLPQYVIARITTGQYDGVDRIWEVEFAPDARE